MKGKVLLRTLWLQKLDWDQTLSCDEIKKFKRFCSDIGKLFDFGMLRRCYDDHASTDLFVFCDASKVMYGFASYIRSKTDKFIECNLLFSKVKSAPLKTKSLPTLELMAVFLAFKCMKSILCSIKSNIMQIFICLDAQIVLSWILSEKVKSKNVFADNRIRDIIKFKQDIEAEFKVEFIFKYVPSAQNSSDFITRGISFSEFESKIEEWVHGPIFLKNEPIMWPESSLSCLSSSS